MRCRSRAPTWASQAAALNTKSLPYCLHNKNMCELRGAHFMLFDIWTAESMFRTDWTRRCSQVSHAQLQKWVSKPTGCRSAGLLTC